MIRACLTVANDLKFQPVWDGQPPLSFGKGIANLQAGYTALTAKASEAEAASSGATQSKAEAESALEACAYRLARALAVHLKSAGDLTRRGQVDLSRTDLVRLRENDLVSKAVVIRDLGTDVQAEPTAADNGVTAERVSALTTAIDNFNALTGIPRGMIVGRKTLLDQLSVDMSALLDQLRDLDDLVLLFDGAPLGQSFITAWGNARVIIDRVGEHAKPEPTPSTTG